MNYLVIFFVSLFTICLELLFTRILNLKCWNHIVYIVVPFAILGYGIGANIYLIFKDKFTSIEPRKICRSCLLFFPFLTILSFIFLLRHNIGLQCFFDILSIHSIVSLAAGYLAIALPCVVIGFFAVYLFTQNPSQSDKLYFADLLGAGSGAAVFFILINHLGIFHSLVTISVIALLLSLFFVDIRHITTSIVLVLATVGFLFLPEPKNYTVDLAKGWEFIPGFFAKSQYEQVLSRWQPMGRTDAYRMTYGATADELCIKNYGTFQVNLSPRPEFIYFANDFLSGTPAYKYSKEGLSEHRSQVKLFSQPMEFPYLILKEPRTVVIGTGGGRDIFMAKTHGVKELVGAEINPVTYSEMMPGGKLHEYTGGVYTCDGVKVYNTDGRHLVKTLPGNSFDLLILNGVDTFSGLSTGAYAYAESYLYTKDAVMDYLRILSPKGMMNFNRWFFPDAPRETLRLFAIALDALRSSGVKEAYKHVIIGYHAGWGMMLVKKTPFTQDEQNIIYNYFSGHATLLVYTPVLMEQGTKDANFFIIYANYFNSGKERIFADAYPYDISVIRDNSPFFYKYYKFRDLNVANVLTTNHPVTGTVVFLSQLLLLINALIFTILFIFVPLLVLRKKNIKGLKKSYLISFIVYFACLGIGFMFVEIPMMQYMVLLLGNPIYSVSIVLAALLIFSGIGSFLFSRIKNYIGDRGVLLETVALLLAVLLICFIIWGKLFLNYCVGFSFCLRVLAACALLLPVGLCLGMFFPAGLMAVGKKDSGMIPWAWAVNTGFTVFGSMLAIMIAQFSGFNFVISIAAVLYLTGGLMFREIA